jgi:hypothetical protein
MRWSTGSRSSVWLPARDWRRLLRVAAAGFGVAIEMMCGLFVPELAGSGTSYYLGRLDGEAVTTAVGFRAGNDLGIFGIATPPAHRRCGYGAAITAHAVRSGFEDRSGHGVASNEPDGRIDLPDARVPTHRQPCDAHSTNPVDAAGTRGSSGVCETRVVGPSGATKVFGSLTVTTDTVPVTLVTPALVPIP